MAENENTEKQESLLVKAAKTVGAAAGKVAATVSPAPAETVTDDKPKTKKGNYRAENLGSGTFLISKPKRKSAKRRQTALKGPRRGARK